MRVGKGSSAHLEWIARVSGMGVGAQNVEASGCGHSKGLLDELLSCLIPCKRMAAAGPGLVAALLW